MPTSSWERVIQQDRIKVKKAGFPFRHTWQVDNGGQGFYLKSWREAIDLAMRWAYTGEHP